MNLMIKKSTLFLIITTVLLYQGCSQNNYYKFTDERFSMGSTLKITFFSYDKSKASEIMNGAYKLADSLEDKFSSNKKNTLIDILNTTKEIHINSDSDKVVLDILNESLEYSKLTDGAFDPVLYNLTKLWGFSGPAKTRVPDKSEIDNALKISGYKNLLIKGNDIRLLNNASVDLGAIAQGKAIGEIADYFVKNGINDFLINESGDIYIKGKYQGKRLWKIAITNPFNKDKFIGFINLSDVCIITSGDYEKFIFDKDGTMYHHILDPKTGYSAINGVHSVTVISKTAAKTDALATATFVMGEKKALDLVNNSADADIIIVTGDKDHINISYSKNITAIKNNDNLYDFTYLKVNKN